MDTAGQYALRIYYEIIFEIHTVFFFFVGILTCIDICIHFITPNVLNVWLA